MHRSNRNVARVRDRIRPRYQRRGIKKRVLHLNIGIFRVAAQRYDLAFVFI
jgi:hypothetical protein